MIFDPPPSYHRHWWGWSGGLCLSVFRWRIVWCGFSVLGILQKREDVFTEERERTESYHQDVIPPKPLVPYGPVHTSVKTTGVGLLVLRRVIGCHVSCRGGDGSCLSIGQVWYSLHTSDSRGPLWTPDVTGGCGAPLRVEDQPCRGTLRGRLTARRVSRGRKNERGFRTRKVPTTSP